MSKEYEHIDLPEASHDAVHAARDAAQAVELARQLQTDNAANAAVQAVKADIGDILQSRIEHVLARGTEQDKSIILARVPYICQDIKTINGSLGEIKDMMKQVKIDLDVKDEKNEKKFVNQDQFSPVQKVTYGVVGLILTGFVGAILALVIK